MNHSPTQWCWGLVREPRSTKHLVGWLQRVLSPAFVAACTCARELPGWSATCRQILRRSSALSLHPRARSLCQLVPQRQISWGSPHRYRWVMCIAPVAEAEMFVSGEQLCGCGMPLLVNLPWPIRPLVPHLRLSGISARVSLRNEPSVRFAAALADDNSPYSVVRLGLCRLGLATKCGTIPRRRTHRR